MLRTEYIATVSEPLAVHAGARPGRIACIDDQWTVTYAGLGESTARIAGHLQGIGWYRTGDLARRDVHGYLRISGRIKELIIRGGENIYPAEVEDALMASEQVEDAAVGVPHPHLGEVPVAFVIPARPGGLDHAAVLDAARVRLSSFELPERLVECTEIPRTGSGKVLGFQLQQRLADVEHSQVTSER